MVDPMSNTTATPNTNTETYRFEWQRHRVAGSTWMTDFAKQRTEPGYRDYEKFCDAHRIGGTGRTYLFAALDTATVERRVVIIDERTVTAGLDAPTCTMEVTIAPRFLVFDGEGRIVHPAARGAYRFETEAEAVKALAKWRKAAAKWHAERAQLDALKDAVRALPTNTCPAGIAPAHAGTQVGDVVLVKGHGYLRAALVIEANATRVKVAYTTRAARNADGTPYAKWVRRSGSAVK